MREYLRTDRNHPSDTFDYDKSIWYTNDDGEIVTPAYAYRRIMSSWSYANRLIVPLATRQQIAKNLAYMPSNRGFLVSYLVHMANTEISYLDHMANMEAEQE